MTDTLAVVLYDGMTALDAIGPMEVLRFVPGLELEFVAERPGPVATDTGRLSLTATTAYDDLTDPSIVVVPGGPGTEQALASPLVPWLQRVHPTTRWTTSVCSGALLLAAAGLLEGRRATSHFGVLDLLGGFGAHPVTERVVVEAEHRIVTAAGVSSGIDMALTLAETITDRVTAEAIQLIIEYDPQPPLGPGGRLDLASTEVVSRAVELGRPQGAVPEFWSPPAP